MEKRINKLVISVSKMFVCPYDHHDLKKHTLRKKDSFQCSFCNRQYPIINGIANFLPDGLREWTEKKDKPVSGWKPGLRGWSPSAPIKVLSFGIGEGRLEPRQTGTILDVGCGDIAKGDVNIDIYVPKPLPQNFVLASAELLPFKDNSFDTVRSAYVIEHNLFPVEMIKEHVRVCKKRVEIFTDNSDWVGIYVYRFLNTGSIFHDEHYYKWSMEYFKNILNRLNYKGKVELLNTSPSIMVKMISLLRKLPRIGVAFNRDLYVQIYKK